MTIAALLATEDPFDERWRQWQAAYASSSRETALRARIAFSVALSALAVALAVQLL